jgi:hypothetical protein
VKQNSMVLFEVVETMLQIINDVVCDGHWILCYYL